MLRTVAVFDAPMLLILMALAGIGLMSMYSAGGGFDGRFADQLRNYGIALLAMWLLAQLSPQTLMRLAVPVYLVGLVLLFGVEFAGETSKGATRWLNLGFTRIQPSEVMKIAVPMMLAWYFHKHQGTLRIRDFIVAAVLMLAPFSLIVLQPDLGTALLVFGAGFFVLFFAGLSFRLLVPITLVSVIALGTLVSLEDTLCTDGLDWVVLHDYQKHRVCTLLNPASDPLGKGFHTIQSAIAVGSGGMLGKGYMQGTQTHLDFIPERTTDFIFAVFAEEFGFVGNLLLLFLYLLLLARGLTIAANAPSVFSRLLSGALTMVFFVYAFVNMGMVSGILPVVGVPLPFMSYGGTALLTLGCAAGILMGIQRHRALVQS
ncbi:MAG: rod shape-determining protein RodA [Bordetella sp. SCN 67-23]|nr:rod shape-determining protein RodA [Burkholderiales bacterium]ODS70690.1 MAG: rod shape-determining protein RodA [Bordetella sp. SCN 67-23]ODU83935.1 MAG: rod shape-determining protein RodA [Bordetella sp. SCN 68-11]OJW94943.1 MAG: rod shape-determining protein RodA [Burkholderiales bacterium 67-32]